MDAAAGASGEAQRQEDCGAVQQGQDEGQDQGLLHRPNLPHLPQSVADRMNTISSFMHT